eukprot:12917242-Prorocentrum_lima.AAC.1
MRVLEQEWQEWVAQRSPRTPTMKQSTFDADVASALESAEKKMSMLEPSLKDVATPKGSNASLTGEVEEHRKHI